MINAVGRDIPEQLVTGGKRVYAGKNVLDGTYIQKVAPKTRCAERPVEGKLCASIREACERCGARDGMTVSFHHHFRNGDQTASAVMRVLVEDMGLKDLTIAATSLGDAHNNVADYIEQGKVTGIQSSGVRGRIGEVISAGKLATPAIIRSHGGRPRAIEAGEVHIDIAFIAASSSDECGNASGTGGTSNCGSLGYAIGDSRWADNVVVITDTLVDFPNQPASIQMIDVDAVVVVDQIGDPAKIGSKEARVSQDPRDLKMAESVADIIAATPWFKDGFSFQTGVGGPSLAANQFIEAHMRKRGIHMGFSLGGITGAVCAMQERGLIDKIIDVQDFDATAALDIGNNPQHFEISASEYANPANKGAYVNKLDFVVLAALEIDTDFNVNVITGSDGVVRGAPGGHPDTCAGSKCSIIVTPLTRGRMPTVCEHVVSVTTPGDCVDVLVTDYGVAVNPLRQDIVACLDEAKIAHVDIEELKQRAYALVGRPDDLVWDDQVVAVVEARDGSILDVIRKVKPLVL